jgi:hypothetical protein
VEETLEIYQLEKKPLPPITSGHDWANIIANNPTSG